METTQLNQKPTEKHEPNSGLIVHQVLAVSYAVYLIAIFLGFIIEQFWDIKLDTSICGPIGLTLIVLGTILSMWAQYVSGRGSKTRNTQTARIDHTNFLVGPYNWTRSPTQYGLVCMALGLALVYGSVVMIATTIIAFILGKFIFIPMEEHHLAKKYGASYEEYKKKVRF